jgi:hypothetical protein
MRIADLPDNGKPTPHHDAGRGVEVGLVDLDITVRIPSACDWLITDKGLLCVKNEKGEEIAHFAHYQWSWVSHPEVVTLHASSSTP